MEQELTIVSLVRTSSTYQNTGLTHYDRFDVICLSLSLVLSVCMSESLHQQRRLIESK